MYTLEEYTELQTELLFKGIKGSEMKLGTGGTK
jgi:TetR/AcrR family transcriptional regulator, cholesterol catabolism regulator